MSEKTNISWCDSTVNWWPGCTKVSPGCQNCFACALAKRYGWCDWGKGQPRHKFSGAAGQLAAMNRHPLVCDECGNPVDVTGDCKNGCIGAFACGLHRRRIFHGDLCDIFDADVPIEWLAEWMDGICAAADCVHILCTKRPENFFSRMDAALEFGMVNEEWLVSWTDGHPPPNIIVLASVENQPMAGKRIPEILKIPAACHGLSLEPLLEPVDLLKVKTGMKFDGAGWALGVGLKWLIIGCESGPRRRFQDGYEDAARSLIQQGQAAGVSVFHKQMPIAGRVSRDPAEWPEDLRSQQWPKGF